MRWCAALFLTALTLAGTAPECSAQLFGKKNKTPPQQRVPELVAVLRADKDAHKRAEAAEELRQYEPKDFPDLVPALVDALQNDQAVNVRLEAAIGLGRLRPISAPAGQALEKAAGNDANLRVRLQAKASLVYYQISGYHAPKKIEPQAANGNKSTTDEPPLAAGNENWWKNGQNEKAPSAVIPAPAGPGIPKPLPSGPTPVVTPTPEPPQGPSLQADPPMLQPAPAWVPAKESPSEGPRLSPPGPP